MKVLSIDIGLYHMGMVCATLYDDYTIQEIHDCDLINISIGCSILFCNLEHGNNICDYMTHFFKNYEEVLDETDIILVEQQPPTGFVAIQELIRYKYRDKTHVVSPRSVHCHFGIQHLDYDSRKNASINYANVFLSGFKNYTFQERKHDISDAYCQMVYWCFEKNREWVDSEIRKKNLNDFDGIIKKLSSFAFEDSTF